jgi:hypothetical protein
MISFQMDSIEYRCYDHLFAVSSCGKVLRKMLPYTPTVRGDGYLGIGRQRLMHRVIAFCWIPNPNGFKQVHHKNGNKSDNRAENLEWVSPKIHMKERHQGISGKYKRTEETRKKISEWRKGRKDSESTRQKKAASLFINCPKRPAKFQGVTYPSVSSAARAAGILPTTFRVRALSKNFPEYELLFTNT